MNQEDVKVIVPNQITKGTLVEKSTVKTVVEEPTLDEIANSVLSRHLNAFKELSM